MSEFVAIDFETANPQRVSACSLGYAIIQNFEIVDSGHYLINPVGGHAPFQTKIHGISEADTCDKAHFGELFEDIQHLFKVPLIAHSLFDKQVLKALSDYYSLDLLFDYSDTSSIAKVCYPGLANYKLKTLVSYLGLPPFNHHNAEEDAIACARIFLVSSQLHLSETKTVVFDENVELKKLILEILEDNQVEYKEAYQLLYWLEDHPNSSKRYCPLFQKTKEYLEDKIFDEKEADMLAILLRSTLDILES